MQAQSACEICCILWYWVALLVGTVVMILINWILYTGSGRSENLNYVKKELLVELQKSLTKQVNKLLNVGISPINCNK